MAVFTAGSTYVRGKDSFRRLLMTAVAVGLNATLFVVLGSSTGAQASPADDLAMALANADPGTGRVVPFASDATASIEGVEVALPDPRDRAAGVTVDVEDGAARTEIGLPGHFDMTTRVVLPDGTATYPGRDRPDDQMAVQLLSDGSTRIQTVLADASSPREYSYSLEGFVPIQGVDSQGEEVFAFLRKGDSGDFVPVAPAWAQDAGGHSVPTRYEVRGDLLVQVVLPTENTSFPVVADPAWVWMYGGFGAKLNRSETSRVTSYAAALGMCGTLAQRFPHVAVSCGAYAGYMSAQAGLANSDRPRRCLFLVVAPAPIIYRYRDGHCR